MPKLDPNAVVDASILVESFEHPQHGWLDFDPRTMAIHQPQGRKPLRKPIGLDGPFVGTKQPFVPTCSMPGPGNAGCPKAHGCPILKALGERPHLGPCTVIAQKKDAISEMACVDFFPVRDVRGHLIYQTNYQEQGWKLAVDRTTVPVLGSVPQYNEFGQKTGVKRGVWQKEVSGLAPYWWPLLKEQGKPLPEIAARYPDLIGDEEVECTTGSSAESSPSVSRGGRKKRTAKARGRRGTGSRNAASAPPSSPTPDPDA